MTILFIKSKSVIIFNKQCHPLQPVYIIRKHGDKHPIIIKVKIKATLIYSEFPQHMDVLPFSVADKSLKMKNKIKSHFILFVL